jgi:hypothetical protein
MQYIYWICSRVWRSCFIRSKAFVVVFEFVVVFAGRVLLGLKPLALRASGFKPNKTLLLVY